MLWHNISIHCHFWLLSILSIFILIMMSLLIYGICSYLLWLYFVFLSCQTTFDGLPWNLQHWRVCAYVYFENFKQSSSKLRVAPFSFIFASNAYLIVGVAGKVGWHACQKWRKNDWKRYKFHPTTEKKNNRMRWRQSARLALFLLLNFKINSSLVWIKIEWLPAKSEEEKKKKKSIDDLNIYKKKLINDRLKCCVAVYGRES